jgi:thiol-disulfide isomerase/thioredoxin
MPALESVMLPLGTPAPDFALPDAVSTDTISLDTFAGKRALLVMFICPHCPFVKHVNPELARLGRDYAGSDLAIVAISSNDVAQFPEDGPEGLAHQAHGFDFSFPYCFDETQDVARAYQAACTPDFFLFDSARRLIYRGQLDDSRPSNTIPVTGSDLRAAIDATLAGKPVPAVQKPSIGCNIKWKA